MADSDRDGPQRAGGQPDQPAAEPAPAPAREPDPASRGEEPPTGGLKAVLGKLRDAAAAHDDERADPDGLPQLS